LRNFNNNNNKTLKQNKTKSSNSSRIINKSNSKKENISLTQDKFYNEFYTNNDTLKNGDFSNNAKEAEKIGLIKLDNEIEFGKALDTLHNELFSIDLYENDF
jgi:hypothetical protein